MIGKGGLDRIIAFTVLTLAAVVGIGFIAANWDPIIVALNDPMQFTGRAAIWHAELAYIGDHPLLGAGFGAFADTGARSPLFGYMGEKWIGTIAHGHSGYLELMVTTGIIGLPDRDGRRRDPAGPALCRHRAAATVVQHLPVHAVHVRGHAQRDGIRFLRGRRAAVGHVPDGDRDALRAPAYPAPAMATLTPFFTVVIPVYNRAHLLARALRSVLAQTCGDFEAIVVDDGSADDPESVVKQFPDPRIRFLRQENRGGGGARNTGIDAARGRYCAFLDSDDEFLPHHLAALKHALDGSGVTAAYARIVVDRGNGRSMIKPPRAPSTGEHMATYLMCDRGFVPTTTLAVETALARRVRYHENLRASEDTDFAIRLFLAGARFAMIREPGGIWHDVPDPSRSSAGRDGTNLMPWLESLSGQIPARAYYGYRGWTIAKTVAVAHPWRALGLYLTAVKHGCYRPQLAAIIFLQIFLPDRLYRRIADRAIGWLATRPPRRAEAQSS